MRVLYWLAVRLVLYSLWGWVNSSCLSCRACLNGGLFIADQGSCDHWINIKGRSRSLLPVTGVFCVWWSVLNQLKLIRSRFYSYRFIYRRTMDITACVQCIWDAPCCLFFILEHCPCTILAAWGLEVFSPYAHLYACICLKIQ